MELGNSWEVEPLRLGGGVLALQSQTIKEAPISNTHPVCSAFRLMPWPLGVLSTWNRKEAIGCTRGFLIRHSNGNAENQEGCRLSEFYLVIHDPCSPLVFRSGFAHGGGGKERCLQHLLSTHSSDHPTHSRENGQEKRQDKSVGKEGKCPLTTGCADSENGVEEWKPP